MSYSSEAAEQVLKMTLETTETAVKVTGRCAKEVAVMLCAVLRQQKKTKGKTRLVNMLKSGKELKVFAVNDGDLVKFSKEAKKYGVLYCVLKDRDAKDGITDVMVRAEDAGKINRIFERFNLSTVDMASVRSEIERAKAIRNGENKENPEPNRSKEDIFLDALMTKPEKEKEKNINPKEARTEKSHQSAPFSEPKGHIAKGGKENVGDAEKRLSVRQMLKDIRKEMGNKSNERGEKNKAPKSKGKER